MTRLFNKIDAGNSFGFTMIEIISVLIILGMFSAYVAKTSMTMVDTAKEISELNQVKTHLKYAQGKAMNTGALWGIHFSGDSYALFRYGPPTVFRFFPGMEKPLAAPTENDCKIPLPTGITYTRYIWFDIWGRAYEHETTLNPATASPISANIEIVSDKLTIEANTGYIHDT